MNRTKIHTTAMPDREGKNADHDLRYRTLLNNRFGNPAAGNYSNFERDGTYVMNGSATVWEDLRIPGHSVQKGASAPDLGPFLGAGNLLVNRFDGGVLTEQVYFTIQLSHAYRFNTAIYPHVHWTPVDGNAGNVYWQLEYSWADIMQVFPAVNTIGIADAAAGVAWTHQYAPFAAIAAAAVAGQGLSSMLVCRLFRDPTNILDTYNSDAAFLEVDIHIEYDTIGSRQELVK